MDKDTIVDTLVIIVERALNKKDIEMSMDDMDALRDVLDEILSNKEIE